MKSLRHSFAALLLALIPLQAFAEVTIFTGQVGGGYDAKAQEISQRLAQRGIETEIDNRVGSDDITLQSCQTDESIWIAQIDALYNREMKDGCFLPVLADYGTENAMLLFAPGSKNSKLKHLGAADTVFIDKVGSGSELTWRTMVAIEKEQGKGDDWSEASVENGDIRRVTALANRGQLQAVFLVRKTNSVDVSRLIEQGWTLGEMYDRQIDDVQYGTKPLYEGADIVVQANGRSHKAYSYAVPAFIGTTEAVERDNPDLYDALLGAFE